MTTHDLGPVTADGRRLRLLAIDPAHASELGHAFSAIDPWAAYPYPASALAAYFARVEQDAPRYEMLLGERVVGVLGIRSEWLRGPYLQFLGVLPAAQGLGLGSAVLAWFEQSARDRGQRNLWVAASDFNEAAIRFYRRHGFAECARLDGLVADGHTEVLLRKKLT